MKKIVVSNLVKNSILFLVSLILVSLWSVNFNSPEAYSDSNLPPSGKTGSPGDGGSTCTACHSGTAQAVSGWITSTIPGTGYVAGSTYTITATATATGVNTYGFEISPQNATGTKLGTLVNTSTQTGLIGTGYIGQKSSGQSGAGSKTWTFDWIAPTAGTGAVTFYGAFNCANGNGSTSGDAIKTSSLTVQEAAAVGTDAGIASIVYPISQACSTTFNPQVTLKNYGSNTLVSVTINYQVDGGTVNTTPWAGSLATNASTVVSLPSITTSGGAHTFDAYTTLPNAVTDDNSVNDAATQSSFTIVTPSTLPFAESFEGTFPPTGWSILDPDAASSNNTTWAKTTAVASAGSASAKLDIYGANAINGQHDAMVSPPVDLGLMVSASLTFDVAYAYYTSPLQFSDTLKVWISTDCGISYNQAYLKAGNNLATAPSTTNAFVPTANQWRTETIDLTSYVGNQVIVKFECVNDWENNLYIDNINLSGISTGVEDITMDNNLKIYPNPSTGIVTILGEKSINSVFVYSYLGKLVKSFANTNSNNRLDLSSLDKGIYFLEIESNGKSVVKKLILSN